MVGGGLARASRRRFRHRSGLRCLYLRRLRNGDRYAGDEKIVHHRLDAFDLCRVIGDQGALRIGGRGTGECHHAIAGNDVNLFIRNLWVGMNAGDDLADDLRVGLGPAACNHAQRQK